MLRIGRFEPPQRNSPPLITHCNFAVFDQICARVRSSYIFTQIRPISSRRTSMEAAHEIAIPQRGKLLKILGVGFGLAICIGATVGVGILRSPGLIAQYLGSPGLIMFAWALGAVYAILGANVLAELGTSTPKSGGMYVFAHRALGDYWGFVAGVCDWFQTAVALAFLAVVFGEYAASLFAPNVAGARPAFSVAVLVMLAALNWKGVREGSTMQKMTSFLKALALVAFVVACFI